MKQPPAFYHETKFDLVADALFEALETADQQKVRALFETLTAYRTTYHRTAARLGRIPAMAKIMDAIDEAANEIER